MKRENGITLIALIVTIAIMIILAGTAVTVGIDSIIRSDRLRFESDLRIINAKVSELVEEYSLEELNQLGKSVPARASNALEDRSPDDFRYFDKDGLESLGIQNIDREVIINFSTKEVLDINGMDYYGKKRYILSDWTDTSTKDYNTLAPAFDLSKKVFGLNALISVDNIEYRGQSEKGKISYKLNNEAWHDIEGTEIPVTVSGTYTIRVTDYTNNYAEKTIDVVLANKPVLISGMIPIFFNDEGEPIRTTDNGGIWYDYAEDGRWACAFDKDYYHIWTWIPRYMYKNGENSGDVTDVKFLKGSTNIASDNTNEEIANTGEANSWSINDFFLNKDYGEVSGIWVSQVVTEDQQIENIQDIIYSHEIVLTQLPSGWDESKVDSAVVGSIVVDGANAISIAPIPKGFTASDIEGENEISKGLVIYQGTEKVSEDEDAITTRNQFVWIPVTDINSMVMCKSNTTNSICNIVLEDGELVCKTHNTTGATNMCGRLYTAGSNYTTVDGKNIFTTSVNYSAKNQTYTANSGYREPAIVTGNNTGDGTSCDADENNYHGFSSASEFLTQMQSDFYAMAKSVARYKGFYIGRYEAGSTSNAYSSIKGQTIATLYTTANRWYALYNNLKTNIDNINSQMIWGCQYGLVIKFIIQNRGESELDPLIGHADIGLKAKKDVSGAVPDDKMKNIYDLTGNVQEITAAAYNNNSRYARGGDHLAVKINNYYSAANGGPTNPTTSSDICGTRQIIYL